MFTTREPWLSNHQPHGTLLVLAGQGEGCGCLGWLTSRFQLPNSATLQHTPALGELDLGQRLLVDFWVNPWQNHALGKVSQFQLCNSATPQHTPRTWGVAELELKGFVRLQVPNSATPQLRSTPPHLGSCRVGTQRLCEAPSPQVRNSAAPPRTWGVGFGAASVANFGEDGGHYRYRS